MNAMALEVDNEDDGCENGDVEEDKIEQSVLKLCIDNIYANFQGKILFINKEF